MSSIVDSCQLSASVSLAADHVDIHYEFHNGSDKNAYLFNLLFDNVLDGVFVTEPQMVYVDAILGETIVAKKIWPVPPDIDVEKPVIPCLSRVFPGKSFTESIRVELPLMSINPYSYDLLERKLVKQPLFFELGYFLCSFQGERLAKEVKTPTGAVPRFDPFPEKSQRVFHLGPLANVVAMSSI